MSGSTPRKQPSATVAAVLSSPQADDAAAATSPRKALSGAAGNTVATTMAATTHDNNNSNNNHNSYADAQDENDVSSTTRTRHCDDMRAIAEVAAAHVRLHGDGDGDNNNSNGVAYREGNKTRRTGDSAAGGADDVFAMMTTSGAAGAATMATEPLTATCDTYSSRSCSKNAAQQPQQQQQPRSMREDNGSVSSARATATTTAVSPSVISRSPTQTHATRTTPTTTAVASGAATANACYAHVIAFVNPGSGNRGAAAFILRTLLHEIGASRVLLLTKDVFSDTTRLRAMIRDKAVCYAAVTTAASSSSSNGDGSAAAAAAAAVRRLPRRGTVFVAGGDGTVSFVMTQIDAVRQELEDAAAAAAAAAATHAATSNNNNNNNKSSGSASALHKDKVEHMSKFVYDSEEDDAHDAATLSLTGTATVSSLSSTRHVAAAAAAAATAAASSHVADSNGSRCGARNDVECSRRLFLMPAIAPLPLGTGNDFSNCVGLGSGFTRRWLRCGCADDDGSSTAVADDDVVAEGDGAHAAPSLLGSLCCVGCGEESSTCSSTCCSRSLFACDEQAALVRLLRTAIAAPCVPFDRWAVDLVPLRVAQEYVRQRSPRDGDNKDDNNNKSNTISKDVEGDTASVRTLTDTAASVLVTTCSDATPPPPQQQQQQRRLALRRRKHTPSQVQQQQQQQQRSSRTRPQRDGDADVLMSTTNDNNNDNDGGRDGNNNSKAVDNSVTHDASVTVTSRRAAVSPTTAVAATRSTMHTRNDDDDGGKGSIANAVHDVDWRAIRNDHQCVTRAAMNYFSIGYDAYITCQFDDFRRRHPNVCASRLRNKAVYGLIGVRAARRCRPLRALVPMVCVPSPYPRLYRTTTSTAATTAAAAATSPSRLRRGGDGRVQRPRLSSPSARHGRAAPRDMVALQLPSQSKVLLLTNIDCYASGNHPWQPQRGTAYYKPVDLVDDTLVRLHDPHTPSPRVAASEQRSDTQNNNNGNNNVNAPAAAVAAAVAAVPPPPPPPMTGVVLNDRKFELQAMGGVLHYAAMNVHASSAQRLAQTDEMFVFVLCTPADLHCPRTTMSRYTRQHLQPYASRLPHDARLRASLNVQIDGEAMPRIAEPTIVHVRPYTTHRVRVRCLNPAVVQLRDTYGSTHNGDAPL